jgi:hypothetical protein
MLIIYVVFADLGRGKILASNPLKTGNKHGRAMADPAGFV